MADSVECNGGNTGKIYVKISGGNDPYTYKLYTDAGFPVTTKEVQGPTLDDSVAFVTDIPIGKYWVWVTDFDNLDAIQSLNVYEPDILKADSIGVNSGLTCSYGSDAELEVYASGGNPPYSYQWLAYNFGTTDWDTLVGETNKTLSGIGQGWYTAVIQDQNGCGPIGFDYVSTEIIFLRGYSHDAFIPDSIDISDVSWTNSCTGDSTGTITITASGGTIPLKYAIVRPGVDSTTNATGLFTGIKADTYRIYVIDGNDCFKRDTDVVISTLANPTVSILPPSPADACPGLPLALDGNPTHGGGTSFTSHVWSGVDADSLDNKLIQTPNFTSVVVGGYNVTYTATDNNGCFGSGNLVINVDDLINPTITCIAPPTRNVDAGQCYYTVSGTEFDPTSVNDNCAVASVVNDVNGTATLAGEQIIEGTVVIWTVTDYNSNTAQCNYTVTVNDNEDPTITCIAPPTRNVDAGQCYYTVVGVEFDPTLTNDNCGVASITNNINGTATLAGELITDGTVVIWTVMDLSTNTAQCNYTVTVVDNEDPTISCIAPPTRNTGAGQCYYTVVGVEFDPTATGDNCGIASVVNDVNGTTTLAGEQIIDGTIITWTITDNSSNTAQCNYIVIVNDLENPTITCIAPPTRNVDPGQCYYTVVGTEFDPTSATDNCGFTVTNDINGTATLAGEQIADGTVVTWTITDNSANTAQCNYTVTVNDNEDPTITCIAPPIKDPDPGQCYYTVVGIEFDPVSTNDNCGIASVVNDVNGTATLAGEQITNGTLITWTITDNSANTAQCNYTVTVNDTEDPTITCIAPPTRNVDPGQCYYTVVGVEFDPTATGDNCGIASVVNDINGTATLAGELITDGTVVTWTITDNASNTAQCNYTVTVIDNENPTITCIAPPTRNTDAGQCYYTVVGVEFDPTASGDNCGISSIVNDVNGTATLAGEQIADGTVVTWTVTDLSLNTAQCNYTVTVNDIENPSITCIAPPTKDPDAGQCYYTVVGTEFDPVSTGDNCGIASVINDVNGTATLAGEQITDGTIITWTITDNSANTAQCNYTVTITDNEDPTITCIAPPTRNVDAGQCYYTVVGVEFDPTSTGDNCGIASVVNDLNGTATLAGEQITDGTIITWTITDNSANTAQCNYTVTVVDNEDPTITCIAPPTRNVDAGQCYYTVVGVEFDPTATGDNCGFTVTNDINGTATLAGEQITNGTIVTWTITDISLNTAQCNYTVTVIDNENPIIICIAPPIRNTDPGQCYYTVVGTEFDPTTTTDNCGFTVTNDFNGTSTLAGEQITHGIIIIWTITDNSANTAQCNYTVTVNDNENPTITCPVDALVIQDGSCTAVVNGLAPVTGDNCGVTLQTWSMVGETVGNSPVVGINDVSGTIFNIGITTVTYHIEDAMGNFIECSFDVEIYDVVDGGLIDANQIVCYNTIPNPFTDEAPASVCGGLTYQWQMKFGVGAWADIPGATLATYSELSNLTEITYYNRKAISDLGFGTAYSDTLTITIEPEPIALSGADATLCYGDSYHITDADTTNSDGVTWEIFTGSGSLDNINIIDPTYTPVALDGGTIVELVLHASGNASCLDATDTIRLTYLSELLVAIGKPTPFLIDSTSTDIDVYFTLSKHNWIGGLGLFLVSPLDSVVELKPYCTGLPSALDTITIEFYNDPTGASGLPTVSVCSPTSGQYVFSGDWKKKLHGQDPSNGSWRVRIGDNRNFSDFDGELNEATITFSDFNASAVYESVLYADSSINMIINESPGGGVIAITEYALPITGLTTSCFGVCDATAVATASGGLPPYVLYEWSNSLDFSTPFAVGDTVDLCAGIFYVQATDSHGCIAVDSITVAEPPEIVITNRTLVNNSCFGDSIGEVTLEFTGGTGALTYTHDKNLGPAKNSGETFDILKAGTYIFTISDANCSLDTTIIITAPTTITSITTVTDITCYGADDGQIVIAASGGTPAIIPPAYQYSIDSTDNWSPGNTFNLVDERKYIIAVQDSLGCIHFGDTIEMLNPDTISIDAITVVPTTCSGGGVDGEISISASGGASTLEYSLDGISYQLSNTFSGLSICDTTVFVKDDCGFKMLDTLVSVTGPIPLVIDSLNTIDVSCYGGNTGQITVYSSGGSGVYEYQIDGGLNTPPGDNIFTDLIAGTYTLSVRDDGGCVSADSIKEIFEPSELLINDFTIVNASECNLPLEGSITVHANGGIRDYWFNDGGADKRDSTFIISDFDPHTFTVTDDSGCVVSKDTSIIENESLTVTFGINGTTCIGDSDGSTTATPTGGISPYFYIWEDGEITNNITGKSAGYYTVTITDSSQPDSCELVDSAYISEPAAFDIDSDIRDELCINGVSRNSDNSSARIIVDVSGGTPDYFYTWTGPSGFTSGNDTINDLESGTYNLTVTDDNSCSTTFSAIVGEDTSYDILSFDVDFEDNSVCWNEDVRFTATYSDASIVDSIIIETQTLTGSSEFWNFDVNESPFYGSHSIEEKIILWKIRAINSFCYESAPIDTIDYFPDFELDIIPGFDGGSTADTIYLKGATTGELGAIVADYIDVSSLSFAWTPELSNIQFPTIQPQESEIYSVVVTSTDNCVDSSEVFLEFIPLITPYTGFSPNGDGRNDYWKINFIDKFPSNIVTVYNRWGIKVFGPQKGYDNSDTSKSWDGTKNGKELPSGTYYYVIILNESGFEPISGPITIIR
jgi:gliding motility-associated-like protein